MATLSDLYTHLKTLCEQWFYNKTQSDERYSGISHTHGNISNDGKVGSNANYFVYTTTGGAVTSKQKIGNITTDGKIGSTANLPLITTTNGTVTTGSFGSSANTFCQGNDSRLSDARTPTAHNQASSTITDSNTYSNIGNSSGTQDSINSAIDTKLGQLSQIKALEMVSTLPTASASTMGVLYVINESNKINFYYTENTGTSASPVYAWHKMDTDILDELVVNWSDVQNKPSTFTPSSHTHGNITNDGKINVNSIVVEDELYGLVGAYRLEGITSTEYAMGYMDSLPTDFIKDSTTHSNIGSSANATQSSINGAIDTALSNKASGSHVHGNILNGGTCTTDVTFNSKILVTNSSNQIGTSTAIDVLDSVVQSLINYGT